MVNNLGGFKDIDSYVKNKLDRFNNSELSFKVLFELMFSEKDNILFEKSAGYKIVKTTYGQAKEECLRRAGILQNMLGEGTANAVVGLYMENCVEWIENLWAILLAGYRPLLLNLRLDKTVLENALAEASGVAVISDSETFTLPTIMEEELKPAKESDYKEVPMGTEIMVMSSGTSEHIKLCAYSAEEFHYQINDSYNIIRKCKLMKKHYEGELKLLTFLPFYHVFGLIAVYIWFAFFARTFVQLNDMAPNTIVNTIRRHRVTHIFAVPMFWEKVYEQAVKTIKERGEQTYAKFEKGLRLSNKIGDVPGLGSFFKKRAFAEVRMNLFGDSICFMITGGSEIRREVMEFFNGIGYHLADGYGMTEIGITSVELSTKGKYLNSCSVGTPFESIEYKISDDGELLVRGKAMAKYIIEGGKRTEGGDWFNTRDLAVYENGCYHILGRKDDVVISPNGENLNPNLIEPKFSIENARQVCLISEKTDDKVAPVLLISVDKYLSKDKFEALDAAVKQRISDTNLTGMISKIVYVSDSLIEENDFKLKRASISGHFSAGDYHVMIPGEINYAETPDDEMTATICSLFATALGKEPEDIGFEADFFLDCEGTSLDYFALCAELEKEFEVSIPASGSDSLKSVRDFREYIRNHK